MINFDNLMSYLAYLLNILLLIYCWCIMQMMKGCWNHDSDKNDGDNDHPIVSISGSTIPSSF
jgi:hypothetical protein